MASFDDLKPISTFSDGILKTCYKSDGKEVIVGGADANGLKLLDTDSIMEGYISGHLTHHTEDVTCIASSETGFASGGTDGLVLLYTVANEFQKILVRSATPVRDIAYHPNGSKLAIASDDNDLRIVLVADNSKIVQLKGHKNTVKSVSYNSDGNYIVSCDANGTILIWSVGPSEPVPRCVKSLFGLSYKAPMDSILQNKVSWNPDNSSFAVAGSDSDICVVSAGTWQTLYKLENEHSQEVITFAWSPNGHYLASSGQDKLLVIWDTKSKKKVRSEFTAADVTGLAWHPFDNQLAVTNVLGETRMWNEVIPTDSLPHPAAMKKKQPTPTQIKAEKVNRPQANTFEDNEAMDDDEEGEDLDLGDDVNMSDEEGEELDEAGEDVGDFVIDDDGAGYVETEEQKRAKQQQRLQSNVANSSAVIRSQRKLESQFEAPATFQPGETPFHKQEVNPSFEPTQGERRYMAYNLIGAVTTIFEGDHSIVDVEFHDQSQYRNYHFTDPLNYSMAAISSAGAVFAVEGKEKPKKPKKLNADGEETDDSEDEFEDENEANNTLNSTLYFRPNNWGQEKDWTVHMLPGEDVVSVAINRVSVIATTSLGYVRIFSISGIQRHVFSLENVVSIAANADLCLIIYSTGPAFSKQQNLKYILMNTDVNEVLQDKNVHITTDCELTWVGFSETNQACIYDSASILRVLQRQRRPDQGCWVPVFDGKAYAKKEQKTEKYWPVGVLRDRLMCVVLRGTNEYPFFPRPPVKDIRLELPLLNMGTEVGVLEEELLRTNTVNLHERDEAEATNAEEEYADIFYDADIQMDTGILKLINLACKAERVSRALDLTYLLHRSESLEKAIKIASFHRYTSLAEKMTNIQVEKFAESDTVTPSTLADSLAALPTMYSSLNSGLESDIAFTDREPSMKKRRGILDDEDSFMLEDDIPSPSKKSRPFQFSK